jgi:hypothetical protein
MRKQTWTWFSNVFRNLIFFSIFETFRGPHWASQRAVVCPSLVQYIQTTRRYIPEGSHLHTRRHETLKSRMFKLGCRTRSPLIVDQVQVAIALNIILFATDRWQRSARCCWRCSQHAASITHSYRSCCQAGGQRASLLPRRSCYFGTLSLCTVGNCDATASLCGNCSVHVCLTTLSFAHHTAPDGKGDWWMTNCNVWKELVVA